MIETTAVPTITSKQLTIAQLQVIVSDLDYDVEKEHRRGSTFYAYAFVEVNDAVVAYAKEEFERDISDQKGTGYQMDGTWDDDCGFDWSYATHMYKTQKYIPERVEIIPARMEDEWNNF